jgi:hypothetical protein
MYGVLYPTYGLRIKQYFKNKLKRLRTKMICLNEVDFNRLLKIYKYTNDRWIAYANGSPGIWETKHIVINATALKRYRTQADVDHVVLHEIIHIENPTFTEKMVEDEVARRAKRLKMNVNGNLRIVTD